MTLKVVRGAAGDSTPDAKQVNQATSSGQTTATAIRAAAVVASNVPGALGGDAAVNQVRAAQRTQNSEKIRNLKDAEELASDVAEEVRGRKDEKIDSHYHLTSSSGSGTLV